MAQHWIDLLRFGHVFADPLVVRGDDINELSQVFLRVLRLFFQLLLQTKLLVDGRELLLGCLCEGVLAFEGSRKTVPQLRASVQGRCDHPLDAVPRRYIRSHAEILNLAQELLR